MTAQFTFKQSLSVLPSMQPVYDLFHRCEAHDKFLPKIYWHSLLERRHDPHAFDYLCFANEQLVGMLNILFFSETAEFTVLIDPAFRGQKLFKKFMQIALTKLKNYVVKEYTLISPYTCEREGAVLDHHEVEMRAPDTLPDHFESNITLTRVTADDAELLATVHLECFDTPDHQTMVSRFSVALREAHRKAYIAKNAQGDIVGKLHAREDFNRVYVHDVGIRGKYRGQGYGKSLMLTWLKEHRKDYGDKPIAVEVLGHNTPALKLYESCGFILTNTYYFWRFKI